MEEHGIPRGESGSIGLDSVGGLLGRSPFAIDEASSPNGDVGIALAGATEPRGDEANRGLGEGGRVDLGIGAGVVDEFAESDRVGRGCDEGKESSENCEGFAVGALGHSWRESNSGAWGFRVCRCVFC